MKKYLLYTLIAVLGLGLSGCKSWMDINTSPNDATTGVMTEALLLSSQQFRIMNNHINSTNAWMLSHHLTKSGEFSGNYVFLNGQIMPQSADDWWTTYYAINWNLKWIYDKAVENEDKAYQGISEILQVLNFQRMVDIWGNIPYSQACDPDNYTQPEYDNAAAIYADLIARADNAIANLKSVESGYTNSELKKVDIMCFGNLSQWVRFAYTIKLRLLMRVSMVQDVAAQVAEIADKCLAIDENIDANPGYLPETDKMNLLYEMYGWDKNGGRNTNHRQYMPSSILVDMLRDNNDPRLRVYFNPRTTLGDDPDGNSVYSNHGLENDYYVGIPYGQTTPSREAYTCTTGTGLLAGSSDKNTGRVRPSTLIAGAEVGFFLAEAALRGMIPGGDAKAKEYYEAAVTSAMKRHELAMQDPSSNYGLVGMADPITGTAEEAAQQYLSQDNAFMNWDKMTTNEQKLTAICSQKWISYVGYNPLEAWFEQRRTDLPVLPASAQSGMNKNICHHLYPQVERNLNMANLSKEPELDVFSSLVFWDKENPVVLVTELYQ